jgi:magnesium-protoporphyrin O-methyltransferase
LDACGCDGFASIFDAAQAERDRERYRRAGPDRTTRILLDKIRPYAGRGSTLLDVGGGIGVIDHELLRGGLGHAVLVDASPAYLAVARQLARETNGLDRIDLVQGDFVRLAPEVDAADVVTLDRVVCCYPDVDRLIGSAADRTRAVLGLVLPRDRWLIRLGLRIQNLWFRLRGKAYRAYAHPNRRVDELSAAAGLRPRAEGGTFWWRVVIYDRGAEAQS